VSAILEALKKLEQETAATANLPLRKEAKRHNQWQAKTVIIPVLISVVLSVLVVAGTMVIFRNYSTDGPIKTARKPETGPAQVVKKIQTNNLIKKNLPQATVSDDLPPTAQNVPSPVLQATDNLPDEQAVTASANPAANPVIDKQPAAYSSEFASIQQSRPPAVEKKIQRKEPVQRDTEPVVRVLEDSTVKLQAISWAPDPDNRMAVINGKICREKDRISGYVIKKINANDVVLAKGSVLGKVVFKIR
jgi:hypothetical protein